jgi:ATP-dependent Clp protease adapter protein ClpS
MAAGTETITRPELDRSDGTGEGGWIVIVFNNEYNTFEQVIGILQKATNCTLEEAEMETWEIHHLGRSLVHHGSKEECDRAADIIRTIGIKVEVSEL